MIESEAVEKRNQRRNGTSFLLQIVPRNGRRGMGQESKSVGGQDVAGIILVDEVDK